MPGDAPGTLLHFLTPHILQGTLPLSFCWARALPPLLDIFWALSPSPSAPAWWAACHGRRSSMTLKQVSVTANSKQHLTEITNICLGAFCFFLFFNPSGIRKSNHLPLINYFPPYLLHFPAEPFCRYNREIFRDNLVIIANLASYTTGIKSWKLPEVHGCTPSLYLWTPVPTWKCKQRRDLESFWQFIKLSRD